MLHLLYTWWNMGCDCTHSCSTSLVVCCCIYFVLFCLFVVCLFVCLFVFVLFIFLGGVGWIKLFFAVKVGYSHNYCTVENFQGRRFSQISRFCSFLWHFSPWIGGVAFIGDKSEQSVKVLSIVFFTNSQSLLPWKFPTIRIVCKVTNNTWTYRTSLAH